MNNRIIGFDIDDTITDADDYCNELLNEFLIHQKGLSPYRGPIRSDKYPLEERYPGLEPTLIKEFNTFWFPRMVNSVPVRDGVHDLFKALINEGYKIHIITRRDRDYTKSVYTGTMMVENTFAWFNKNHLKFDRITFSAFDKLDVCKKHNVDVLVEDSPANILRVSQELPVVVPEHDYNKFLIGTNINIVKDLNPDTILPLINRIVTL